MLDYAGQAVRQVKLLVQYIAERFKKQLSSYRIKHILQQAGYRWKRMRKSLKKKRNEEDFHFFKQELALLHEEERKGELDVVYFDETGISLTPVVPYAWQKKKQVYELPSLPSKNLTVLGFMNLKSQCQSYLVEGAANSRVVAACIEDFSKEIKKKTVVILDQASIHQNKEIQKKKKQWQEKGLFLQFLPPYCPELNKIEILWKHLKYYWLDLQAYQDLENFQKSLVEVLKNIGTKYHINFT